MRNKWKMKVAAIFMLGLMVPYTGMINILYAATTVNVPVGTKVLLKVDEDVTPEKKAIGDKVKLSVVNDVIIEGKTVIAKGAPAEGEIIASTKTGIVGKPAEIGFKVLDVQSVDGKIILAEGINKVEGKSKLAESAICTVVCCIFAIFAKGEKAEIKSGSTVTATIISPASVQVQQ